MNFVFLTEQDLLYDKRYSNLREVFYITGEEIEQGFIFDLFTADPDYVKSNGITTPFVSYSENNGVVFVVSRSDIDSVSIEMIKDVLSGSVGWDISRENTWSEFKKATDAVAYRGGSGYGYAIYVKSY